MPEIDPYAAFSAPVAADDPYSAFAAPVGPEKKDEPEQSLFDWLKESYVGKHDPKYKGIKTIYEQFPDALTSPTASAAILGASDPQMTDIIAKHLGDKFLRREKDEHGYDVLVTRTPEGQEQKGYVNAPGLDTQDLWRTFYGAAPYAVTGLGLGAAAKKLGLGTLASAGLQALGAGSTSVAGDIAQAPLGSEQGVDPDKAVLMTALGGLGEVAASVGSAAWRRFITEPKYFNRGTGELTDLGKQAARDLGLDPAKMASDIQKVFARTYVKSPQQAENAVVAVADREFGIPSTLGQRLKDPEQLMKEKGMRSGVYGAPAKEIIRGLDDEQRAALERAVQATIPETVSGQPVASLATPGDAGDAIASGVAAARGAAKAQEKAAWQGVQDIAPTKDALELLPPTVAEHVQGLPFHERLTPTALTMVEQIKRFMEGRAPNTPFDEFLNLNRPPSIDAVRRQLLTISRNAVEPSDKLTSTAIYNAFDDWMERAAEQGLLSGDVGAVTALRTARDITKEMHGIFAPRVGNKLTPGGRLLEKVKESADTPERVVSTLFSGPKAEIKQGSIEALNNIKRGLDRYADPVAANKTWNDIRLAHWAKIMLGGNGEVLGPQALKENLKHALNKQATLMTTLYNAAELSQMRRFLQQLEKVTYKDPNPSGTATGVAVFAKQLFTKILDAVPYGRAAWEYSMLPTAYGKAVAKKAVAQEAAKRAPSPGLGFVAPAIDQGLNTGDQ